MENQNLPEFQDICPAERMFDEIALKTDIGLVLIEIIDNCCESHSFRKCRQLIDQTFSYDEVSQEILVTLENNFQELKLWFVYDPNNKPTPYLLSDQQFQQLNVIDFRTRKPIKRTSR